MIDNYDSGANNIENTENIKNIIDRNIICQRLNIIHQYDTEYKADKSLHEIFVMPSVRNIQNYRAYSERNIREKPGQISQTRAPTPTEKTDDIDGRTNCADDSGSFEKLIVCEYSI